MDKYHFNPRTGRASICNAKVRPCPFGTEKDHYPLAEAAVAAFDRKMRREAAATDLHSTVTPLEEGQFLRTDRPNPTVELPGGRYFIGDPYLLFGEKDQTGWNNWVKTVGDTQGWENTTSPDAYETPMVGAFYDGEPLMAVKTVFGRGTYYVANSGLWLPSDSGLIGAVTENTIQRLGFSDGEIETRKLGQIQNFEGKLQMSTANGAIGMSEDLETPGHVPDMVIVHSTTVGELDSDILHVRRRRSVDLPPLTLEEAGKLLTQSKDKITQLRNG